MMSIPDEMSGRHVQPGQPGIKPEQSNMELDVPDQNQRSTDEKQLPLLLPVPQHNSQQKGLTPEAYQAIIPYLMYGSFLGPVTPPRFFSIPQNPFLEAPMAPPVHMPNDRQLPYSSPFQPSINPWANPASDASDEHGTQPTIQPDSWIPGSLPNNENDRQFMLLPENIPPTIRSMSLPQTTPSNRMQPMPPFLDMPQNTPQNIQLYTGSGMPSPNTYSTLPYNSNSLAEPEIQPDEELEHSHVEVVPGVVPECCETILRGMVEECARCAGLTQRELLQLKGAPNAAHGSHSHPKCARNLAREAIFMVAREFECDFERLVERILDRSRGNNVPRISDNAGGL